MNLHVIIGEDDYLVQEAAKNIIGDGVGLEVIDSINSTNAELQLADLREADASLLTPPFLEPKKITWWKNVDFLPRGGKGGPAEEVKAALEKFASKLAKVELPENQQFILSGPQLLASSIFAKTLKGAAEIITFASLKPWEQAKNAVVRVIDLARELNLQFEPGAADRLVAIVGTDARSLNSEIAKLREYLGKARHTIQISDVDEIASQGVGVEPEVWSVTDAIGARKLSAAITALRRFEKENGFAVMMTTLIEKLFRQLAELKDAQMRGMLNAATREMAPYAAKKMVGFLSAWRLNELRAARFRFLKLRERAVSSGASIDVLVVTEVVRTIGKA